MNAPDLSATIAAWFAEAWTRQLIPTAARLADALIYLGRFDDALSPAATALLHSFEDAAASRWPIVASVSSEALDAASRDLLALLSGFPFDGEGVDEASIAYRFTAEEAVVPAQFEQASVPDG